MSAPGASGMRPWLVGVVVLAACVWAADLGLLRAGVPHPLDDTWDYGVVARHLLAGQGLRTSAIHPPLWPLRDAAGTVPVLVHGPLLPVLLAPLVLVAGPSAPDRVAWIAALFALLTAVSLFRLGARHAGPAIGAAAAGVWTLSPLVLHAVNHDPSLPLGAFLLTLALDHLGAPRPRGLAGGLALGLAALARPEMTLAFPVALALARGARRSCAAGFLACLVPWWSRALLVTGNPFFSLSSYLVLGYSERWPGLSVLRDFHLVPRALPEAIRESLPWLARKWLDFLPHALKRAALVPSEATGWLVLVGAAAALARRDVADAGSERRMAVCALALAVIPVAVMTVTIYDPRYLTPFLPLWALGAALGARTLAAWMPPWARRPRSWMGLLLLVLLPSTGPALSEEARQARAIEPRLAAERAALGARGAPAGEPARPLFSDTPDFVAWTTGRPVVWLSRAEYERLAPCERTAGDRTPATPPCRSSTEDSWFHAEP